ncbi:hypothetical protein [Mycobacterium sp. OTB74]|uniref:hypothetical protein n=1 Tax=Mycobacterium sp. OTB74 TaxID=1853452 RepID=UPI00247555E2|nr:hypothetical protein [Mycobacterium sp. OTB74]MDH6246209.1 hypothetical protein [Mycobacterium sp. OTB74]
MEGQNDDFVINFTAADGRWGWIFIVGLFGIFPALAIVGLTALILMRHDAMREMGPFLFAWFAFICMLNIGMFGPMVARLAALGIRSGRGGWWLRLSSTGFEVNDRVLRPRRYAWRDIDRFVLGHANLEGIASPRVGFRYAPDYSLTLRKRLCRRLGGPARDPEGVKIDVAVMGYWDRPFAQAVELMNNWLTRYRNCMPD